MKQNHYTLNRCLLLFVLIFLLINGISAQSFDIYLFDIKEHTTKKVTNISNAGEYNATWSPDGKKIAHDVVGGPAAPYDQSIFITDIKSHISKPLIGAEGGNDAAWSSCGEEDDDDEKGDGNRSKGIIAFEDWHISPYSIYTVPATGGTRSLLRSNCHHASWNPKGNKIAFDDNNGYIGTKDLRTGIETFVTGYGDRPSWSPDGQYIAFDGFGWTGGGVWVIKVDALGNPQGVPRQLTTSGYGPTWSNNSKTIYYIDWPTGDPDVWSVRVTGGTATKVCGRIGGFDKGDYDPACSYNGKLIAFSSYTDSPATAQRNTTETARLPIRPEVSNKSSLEQNYPNPFTTETAISFRVASFTHVILTVYNITGQKIKTLADANYDAGSYTIKWNGKDNTGKTLPEGMYLCQMLAGSFAETKKMILLQ